MVKAVPEHTSRVSVKFLYIEKSSMSDSINHRIRKTLTSLGVYTRVSVYRDWINTAISSNALNRDPQLLNMLNNIDTNNNLEIWWDRDTENSAKCCLSSVIVCVFLLSLII